MISNIQPTVSPSDAETARRLLSMRMYRAHALAMRAYGKALRWEYTYNSLWFMLEERGLDDESIRAILMPQHYRAIQLAGRADRLLAAANAMRATFGLEAHIAPCHLRIR